MWSGPERLKPEIKYPWFTVLILVFYFPKMSLRSGVEVIKLCSVLEAQKSCSKHEIKHFDWLILESEYKYRARKFYDRKAWSSNLLNTAFA